MDQAHQLLLDRNYRFQRHIYDVTREYYLLGRDHLIATLDPPERAAILEVGCGTARNLVRMSRRYPKVDLFGIDLSQAMLETASAALTRQALRDRIALGHADAATFDPRTTFQRDTFDRIVFSYTLSMIPRWQDAIGRAYSCLAPGGVIHIVDFGSGHDLPRSFNAALRSWLEHFHVSPRDNLAEFLRGFASANGATVEVTPLFRDYAILAVLRRK